MVVIVAIFDGGDQFSHQFADEWRLLKAVSTCTDRYVIATDTCLVVDRNPVVGEIVDADDSAWLTWDSKIAHASCKSQSLRLPRRLTYRGDRILWRIQHDELIAIRFHRADDDRVAGMDSKVRREVRIGYACASIIKTESGRSWH